MTTKQISLLIKPCSKGMNINKWKYREEFRIRMENVFKQKQFKNKTKGIPHQAILLCMLKIELDCFDKLGHF